MCSQPRHRPFWLIAFQKNKLSFKVLSLDQSTETLRGPPQLHISLSTTLFHPPTLRRSGGQSRTLYSDTTRAPDIANCLRDCRKIFTSLLPLLPYPPNGHGEITGSVIYTTSTIGLYVNGSPFSLFTFEHQNV